MKRNSQDPLKEEQSGKTCFPDSMSYYKALIMRKGKKTKAKNREPRRGSIHTTWIEYLIYTGWNCRAVGQGQIFNKCFWDNWIIYKENKIKLESTSYPNL